MSQSYNPFYNIENPQLMGYEYAWSSFMRGQGLNNAIISQEIGQSWERCRNGRIQMNFKGNTSNTPGEAPNTQETFLKQTGGKMLQTFWRRGIMTASMESSRTHMEKSCSE